MYVIISILYGYDKWVWIHLKFRFGTANLWCKMKNWNWLHPKKIVSGQRCLLSSHNARTIWFRSFESFTIMCTVCKIITHAFIINIFAQTIYGNNLAFNTKRGVIIFVKWFYYQIIKNYSFVYYEVPWTCFINNFSLFQNCSFSLNGFGYTKCSSSSRQ